MNFVVSSFLWRCGDCDAAFSFPAKPKKDCMTLDFCDPLPWFTGAVQAVCRFLIENILESTYKRKKIKNFTNRKMSDPETHKKSPPGT